MISKTILAATIFAAVTLVLGMSVAPVMAGGPPAYTTVNSGTWTQNGNSLSLSVSTAGDIPRFADTYISNVLVFGYAWPDLQTGDVVLATIHPFIGRDSNQNPDAWHTHPGTLGDSANNDFCVLTLGTSQGGLSIQGTSMGLNIPASQAGVSASAIDAAVAFVVVGDGSCGTGLGVDVFNFGVGL